MNFTGIDFTTMPDNSLAYIAFDLEYGFRLLEEKRDLNAVYFRDLLDPDVDGVSDTAVTTQGLIIKSSLVAYNNSLGPLEDRVGKLIKIGDTWATVLLYNSNRSVVIDNYPTKLPPIQSIQNNLINVPLHGLANNDPIQFSGITPPIGITEGTTYYVRNPTTNSFNISATSGGSNITLTDRGGELHVSKLYSVFVPTLDYDVIKDTIIGKVIRTGNFYSVETFYNVSGESITSFELVDVLPAVGAYEGQVVLYENTIYTWNGASWVTGTGTSSRTVSLSVSKQAFTYDSNSNLIVSDPVQASTITTTAFGTTGTLTYVFKVDGATVLGSGNTYNYTPNASYDAMPDIITVDLYEDGLLVASDLITMFGVIEGSDAITAILSNEAHTIPTNSAGNNGSYTGSGTTIKVYNGTTELTYETGSGFPSTNGRFRITTATSYIDVGAISGNGTTTATVANASNMTENTASITYTINTRNFVGQNLAITKVQSFSKSRAGVDVTVSTGATAPLNPSVGDIWYNNEVAFYWDGTYWIQIVNAPTGTRTLSSLSETGIYIGEIAGFGGSYYLWDGSLWLLAIDGAILTLSNQSHTLPANSAGVPTTYTGADTRVFVYESGIDNTSTWTLSAAPTNITGSFGAGANTNLYTVSNLSQPSGYVDITATKGSRTKIARFSLSTSSSGVNGGRGAGRWHINVDLVQYTSDSAIGRLPETTADAQEAWDNGVFASTRPSVQVAGDQAWFYQGTIALPTGQSVWIYNGTIWIEQTEVIDGNLLVTDTITADKLNVSTLSAISANLGTVTAGSLAVGLLTGDVTKTTPFRNLTPVVFGNGETTLFEIDLPASTHPQGHKPFSIVTGWMDGTDTRTYRFNMYMKSNTSTSTLLGAPTSAYFTEDGKGNTFYYITYNGVLPAGGDTLTASDKSHIYVSSSFFDGVTTIQYALSSGVAFTTSDSITVNTSTNYVKVGESRFRPFGNARNSFSVSGSLGTYLQGTITMKLTVHRFDNTDTTATTTGANDDIRETSGILMGIR